MSLPVHIWSDVVCPWCYVGLKRFELGAAMAAEQIEITWHSFELSPAPLPKADGRDYIQRLADKYGMPRSQATTMVQRMRETGREVEIDFQFDRAIWANTFDAHRVLHLAGRELPGQVTALKKALFAAHFTSGQDLNDTSTLVEVSSSVGLPPESVSSVLASQELAEEVRADETAARRLGVSGVPFYVIGELGVGGAQRPETFARAIQQACATR